VHDDYGSFVGTVTLPAGSNEDDITATYDKGIFTLSVGVSEATPARSTSRCVGWEGSGAMSRSCAESRYPTASTTSGQILHCFPQRKTFDSGLIDLPKRLLVCKDGFQMRSTVSVCREHAGNVNRSHPRTDGAARVRRRMIEAGKRFAGSTVT